MCCADPCCRIPTLCFLPGGHMRASLRRCDCVLVLLLLVSLVLPIEGLAAPDVPPATPGGTTRTYYIAAEEIEWNYILDGRDMMMTRAFHSYARAPSVFAIDSRNRTGDLDDTLILCAPASLRYGTRLWSLDFELCPCRRPFLDRNWLQGDYSSWCSFPYSALAGFRWTMAGLAFPAFRSYVLATVIPF